MTQRNALVLASGVIEQLQSGDSFLTGQSPGSRNAIINGNFDIWQKGTSFTTPISALYQADLFSWRYVTTGSGLVSISQQTAVPTIAQSNTFSTYSLELTVGTTQASIGVNDRFALQYFIEGYNFRNLAQRSMTLSFWVKSNLTGTFCVALANSGPNQVYVAEYSIATANTWQKIVLAIPASPPSGTWAYDTGVGLNLRFTMAVGTNFQGTAGSWNTSNVFGTSNQMNFLSSTSNNFYLSQIQLEQGDSASNFEQVLWDQELQRCQRYYCKTFPYTTAPAQATASAVGALAYRGALGVAATEAVTLTFPNTMRTTPTITYYNPQNANNKWYNITLLADSGTPASDIVGVRLLTVQNPQVATDNAQDLYAVHVTASAEF